MALYDCEGHAQYGQRGMGAILEHTFVEGWSFKGAKFRPITVLDSMKACGAGMGCGYEDVHECPRQGCECKPCQKERYRQYNEATVRARTMGHDHIKDMLDRRVPGHDNPHDGGIPL